MLIGPMRRTKRKTTAEKRAKRRVAHEMWCAKNREICLQKSGGAGRKHWLAVANCTVFAKKVPEAPGKKVAFWSHRYRDR